MVAQAGGYYGAPFRGEIGVTQGDPLSPTIFDMVVDAVVYHWKSLVVEGEIGDSIRDNRYGEWKVERTIRDRDDGQQRAEEGKQRLMMKAAFFYADDRMV